MVTVSLAVRLSCGHVTVTVTGTGEHTFETSVVDVAGIPDDGNITYRVGWLSFPPDDTAWRLGDRAVRCFLWNNGERMTGSYRDAGTGKLEVHYR